MIGVDWGTTSLRVYDLEPEVPVEIHFSNMGIRRFSTADQFEAHLNDVLQNCAPWHQSVILSGMVTSRNGWVETPYVETPATPEDLAAAAVCRNVAGRRAVFIPGLQHCGPNGPDVIRGEETQLAGILVSNPSTGQVVLPGTHSKWATTAAGVVIAFSTFVTGELFELLIEHSILGAFIEGTEMNEEAFDEGVTIALEHRARTGLLNNLFSVRTRGLFRPESRPHLHSYLSGMLIGAEISGAGIADERPASILIAANEELASRYQRALDIAGHPSTIAPTHSAARGLRHLAKLLETE
jgi:2-dehydro-3-deoxygalactonokinase